MVVNQVLFSGLMRSCTVQYAVCPYILVYFSATYAADILRCYVHVHSQRCTAGNLAVPDETAARCMRRGRGVLLGSGHVSAWENNSKNNDDQQRYNDCATVLQEYSMNLEFRTIHKRIIYVCKCKPSIFGYLQSWVNETVHPYPTKKGTASCSAAAPLPVVLRCRNTGPFTYFKRVATCNAVFKSQLLRSVSNQQGFLRSAD